MELLKQLYKVHSPSGKEESMRSFIMKWAKARKLDVVKDMRGNLYITKGVSESYPCIVAHMDEVHANRPKGFKIVVYKDNYILGGDAEILRPVGIGADDKNGIWCALKILEKYDAVKCAFFVQEETGCHGSQFADMKFFNDCRFVLQADRKGGNDFINDASGVQLCDSKFMGLLNMKKYGYKPTNGLMTDVMTLKSRGLEVACANISCGYYNPHTCDEYTNFAELENCLEFMENIVENVTEVCRHKHIPAYGVPVYGSNRGKYPFVDWMDEPTRKGFGY